MTSRLPPRQGKPGWLSLGEKFIAGKSIKYEDMKEKSFLSDRKLGIMVSFMIEDNNIS